MQRSHIQTNTINKKSAKSFLKDLQISKKRSSLLKYSLSFLILPLVLFAGVLFVHAQRGGINLTVSPVFVSLVTDPGESVESQVRITNNSNETENLRVRLARFVTGDDGAPRLDDVPEEDPFPQWIDFSEDSFRLAPNEAKVVRFTVAPPADAALGYYYAIVFTRDSETQEGEVPQAVIAAAPAVPLLLEVASPDAARELQLVDFKTDKMFYEYLPTNFIVTVKNTGNIHSVPVGDIFIDSAYSEDIAIVPVNRGNGNVLPGGTRSFEASWDDSFIYREAVTEGGKTVYKTRYDFSKVNKFRMGKYQANVLMIYDNGERDVPMEASVSFWVIPWKILGGGLLILVLIVLGLRNVFSSSARSLKRLKK
jgi:hypothetical protein